MTLLIIKSSHKELLDFRKWLDDCYSLNCTAKHRIPGNEMRDKIYALENKSRRAFAYELGLPHVEEETHEHNGRSRTQSPLENEQGKEVEGKEVESSHSTDNNRDFEDNDNRKDEEEEKEIENKQRKAEDSDRLSVKRQKKTG